MRSGAFGIVRPTAQFGQYLLQGRKAFPVVSEDIFFFVAAVGGGLCVAALDFDDEGIAVIRKNVASQVVAGQMNDRTTGAPLTSSVSVFVTGDGGTQTSGSGTLTHEGNGHWSYVPTQAETNFNHLAVTFTHASGVNKTFNLYPVAYDPSDAVGLGLSRLDAAISSRMATYTQPTGFLAATFPGAVSSLDQAGVRTATGLSAANLDTQLAALQADTDNIQSRLPAALISGRMDSNAQVVADKTGYSLSQAFPANFAALSITAGGLVDITQAAADKVWSTTTRILTAGTNIALAKGTGVTGFNDIAAADVWASATRTLTAFSFSVTVGANTDKTGYDLSSAARDAIANAALDLVDAIETGLTQRQALRLVAAALAGKISGADTTTVAIRNAVADTKARITATVTADGNRTAMAYDVS